MSKVAYASKGFSDTSLAVLAEADRITTEYNQLGIRMTLRMLYYQFVARDTFPESWTDPVLGTKNTDKNYKRLSKLVSDGRINGLIDWSYIEDSKRVARGGDFGMESPADAVASLPDGYSISHWDGQPEYVEVWVEKDALYQVIAEPASRWNVTSLACMGSPSTSLMYESARRLRYYAQEGRNCTVLYLGDHDPTGLDIDRDIEERLRLYRCPLSAVHFERIALTWEQVQQYSPPPSPVKETDSRTNGYRDQFGTDECWELDALEPLVMRQLVEDSILTRLDRTGWDEREQRERRERVELQAVADNWQAVRDYMDAEGMLVYDEDSDEE